MAEWLGKPRVTEEDIAKVQPSLPKYFPMLTRYLVEDQMMRLVLVLPHDKADKFKETVTKVYGSFSPMNVQKAGFEALDQWLAKNQ